MRISPLLCSMLALTWMSCGGPSADMVPTLYEETHVEGAMERTVAEMSVQGMMLSLIHI